MTLIGKSNVEAGGHMPKYQITQLRNPGDFLNSPGIHELNYNPIIWSSPTINPGWPMALRTASTTPGIKLSLLILS